MKECCVKFHSTFSHGDLSDIDVNDLFSELKVLQCTLPNETMNALDILKFVKLADCYPNVAIAYKDLIVHVIVALTKRSLSKLKLIIIYLKDRKVW